LFQHAFIPSPHSQAHPEKLEAVFGQDARPNKTLCLFVFSSTGFNGPALINNRSQLA
jgi:hypothetical protein